MNSTTKRDDETRRLMLVDDDAGVRQSLRQLFKRDERLTVVLEQGMAGDTIKMRSDTAPGKRPDLVLLDITMPGMDGIECCRVLRSRFPDLVIAMFTGRPVRECFEPARLAGRTLIL